MSQTWQRGRSTVGSVIEAGGEEDLVDDAGIFGRRLSATLQLFKALTDRVMLMDIPQAYAVAAFAVLCLQKIIRRLISALLKLYRISILAR